MTTVARSAVPAWVAAYEDVYPRYRSLYPLLKEAE